jgi:hypothetical protein
MMNQVAPPLAVRSGNAAIDSLKVACGTQLRWHLESGDHVVAHGQLLRLTLGGR